MKKICSVLLGLSLTLSFQAIALADTGTGSASGSAGLPTAGGFTPTVLVTTLAAILIFVGAVKFFKTFN